MLAYWGHYGENRHMLNTSETNNRLVTLELAALFVFALVLIGNLSVTRFAEGYYSHFGVTLPEINFTPQMYDYVNIVLISVIGAGVVVLVVGFLMKVGIWIGAFAAEKTEPSKRFIKFAEKREQKIITLGNAMEWLVGIFFWGIITFTMYSSVNIISNHYGKVSAADKSIYSSITPDGEDLQKLIIYKSDNEIILKVYSSSKKEFLSGYETINGATYTARPVRI